MSSVKIKFFFNLKIDHEEEQEIECNKCDRSFRSEKGLKIHIGRVHKEMTQKTTIATNLIDSIQIPEASNVTGHFFKIFYQSFEIFQRLNNQSASQTM